MSKLYLPVEGRDYERLSNGAIKVARQHELTAARTYQTEPIPGYLLLVDHHPSIGKKEEAERLGEQQARLKHIFFKKLRQSRRFLIIEAEGRDAAGKTGLRKRVYAAIGEDCTNFQVYAFKRPSQEELDHFWLWKYGDGDKLPACGGARFWERGPSERLLVERVKKLAPEEALNASYAELNQWQWLLVRQGGIYIKLWLDITKREQADRFRKREEHNQEKISNEDWQARKDWNKYTPNINEMLHRIGTHYAPYYVIAADNKRYARVTAFEIINDCLSAALS